MKPQELRIGNIVGHDDYSDTLFEVTEIVRHEGEYVVHTKGGSKGHWINNISLIVGIDFTPAILEKLGFRYSTEYDTDGAYIKEHYRQTFMYYPEDGTLWFEENVACGFISLSLYNPIKHIHQLQNIYYEITGEELKLKSK